MCVRQYKKFWAYAKHLEQSCRLHFNGACQTKCMQKSHLELVFSAKKTTQSSYHACLIISAQCESTIFSLWYILLKPVSLAYFWKSCCFQLLFLLCFVRWNFKVSITWIELLFMLKERPILAICMSPLSLLKSIFVGLNILVAGLTICLNVLLQNEIFLLLRNNEQSIFLRC